MITTYTLIASAGGRVLCQRGVPAADPGDAVQLFWARLLTAEQRAACTCIECTTLPLLLKEPL